MTIIYEKSRVMLEAMEDSPKTVAQMQEKFPEQKPKSLKTQISRLKSYGYIEVLETQYNGTRGRPSVIYAITEAGREAIYNKNRKADVEKMVEASVRKNPNSVWQLW